MTTQWPNPFIEQRADPFILRHQDRYYFIASVPEYDRTELRCADTLLGLAEAETVVVWRKPDVGPMSALIWAPEIHHVNGQWVIYFAAAPSREIKEGLFQHRMYALTCDDADPLAGEWQDRGRIQTPIDSFRSMRPPSSIRASGGICGRKRSGYPRQLQSLSGGTGESRTLKGRPVMLSRPEYEWECAGFSVNEGPAVIRHGNRLFVSYSASATDENYCPGLLWIDVDDDPMQPAHWNKSARPVFTTSWENRQYGPGHNSFTVDEEGNDLLVYHARNYTEIEGDPLWDPNRHTRIKTLSGTPTACRTSACRQPTPRYTSVP